MPTNLLDVVDFHKSCEEARQKFVPLSGIPIYYALCDDCGFCFSPQMYAWSREEFREKVYNSNYVAFDPDYVRERPLTNASNLCSLFGSVSRKIRHLDYGGGDGLLSRTLQARGWSSVSWDPLADALTDPSALGTFNLITAFEVFEHVPDVHQMMEHFAQLLEPEGLLLFSTLISDGNLRKDARLTWWYASPRNGHISLFSKKSVTALAMQYGFATGSFSEGAHLYFKNMPEFARGILQARA